MPAWGHPYFESFLPLIQSLQSSDHVDVMVIDNIYRVLLPVATGVYYAILVY